MQRLRLIKFGSTTPDGRFLLWSVLLSVIWCWSERRQREKSPQSGQMLEYYAALPRKCLTLLWLRNILRDQQIGVLRASS